MSVGASPRPFNQKVALTGDGEEVCRLLLSSEQNEDTGHDRQDGQYETHIE